MSCTVFTVFPVSPSKFKLHNSNYKFRLKNLISKKIKNLQILQFKRAVTIIPSTQNSSTNPLFDQRRKQSTNKRTRVNRPIKNNKKSKNLPKMTLL